MSFTLSAEIPIVTFKGHKFAFYITELQFYCHYYSSQVSSSSSFVVLPSTFALDTHTQATLVFPSAQEKVLNSYIFQPDKSWIYKEMKEL